MEGVDLAEDDQAGSVEYSGGDLMGSELPSDYWLPRDCLRKPNDAVLQAASDLADAVQFHLEGDTQSAARLIGSTNTQSVRDYIESLWGSPKRYPEQVHYLRKRRVEKLAERQPKAKDRMPSRREKLELIERDGYVCRYCSMPVIPAEIRKRIANDYPLVLPWGRTNASQHAAFQALWLQYDHVIPASFGGDSSMDNMVVSCAGCNFAKWNYHLAELGLEDPRERRPSKTDWVGLTNYASGQFA